MDAIIYLKSLHITNIRFDFGRQAYNSLLRWAPQTPVPYHLALRSGAYLDEAQPYSKEEFTLFWSTPSLSTTIDLITYFHDKYYRAS